MGRNRVTASLLFGFLGLVFLLTCGSNGFASLTTVAWTGTDPLTAPLEFFDSFEAPQLNRHGDVVFWGRLQNPSGSLGTFDGSGVWNFSNGNLRTISRVDLELNAPPVFGPIPFRNVFIDDARTTYFPAAELSTDGTITTLDDAGLWTDREGTQANVIDRSVPLGGTNGAFSTFESDHDVNAQGQFAFTTRPQGRGWGVYRGDATGASLVLENGQIVPAINGEQRTINILTGTAVDFEIGTNGNLAIVGESRESGSLLTSRDGIWFDNGTLQLAAMEGQSIDGAPGGPRFAQSFFQEAFEQVQIADQGVAFFGRSEIGVGGITDANDLGIHTYLDGQLSTLVREGDAAPGIPGSRFTARPFSGEAFERMVANPQGQIAFYGRTDSLDGVWTNRSGQLELVSEVPFFPFFRGGLALNAQGQVAFLSPTDGLYAHDISGQVVPIALYGDLVEVEPDVFKNIESIDFDQAGLNDLGQIAFRASFTDGSAGIFLSNAVMVPEPTSGGLCTLLVLLAGLRGRFALQLFS